MTSLFDLLVHSPPCIQAARETFIYAGRIGHDVRGNKELSHVGSVLQIIKGLTVDVEFVRVRGGLADKPLGTVIAKVVPIYNSYAIK